MCTYTQQQQQHIRLVYYLCYTTFFALGCQVRKRESKSIDKVQLTLLSVLVALCDNTWDAFYIRYIESIDCVSLIDIRLTMTHTDWLLHCSHSLML
jgi:hypothetical protein